MTTDFRALCADLIASWDADGCDWKPQHQARWEATVARARAALADGPAVSEGREPASVTGQPSDGDLLQLMPEQFRADLGTVSRMAAHGAGPDIKPGLFRVSLNTGALEYARAVLARWGNPAPQPPAEGEVEELAAKLRRLAPHNPLGTADPTITRAADLLQRLSPPQPVPVSERPWEREGWCDKRGMCWAWNWGICTWWEWVDSKLISYSSGDYTHCLPAHALPIPHQQENAND